MAATGGKYVEYRNSFTETGGTIDSGQKFLDPTDPTSTRTVDSPTRGEMFDLAFDMGDATSVSVTYNDADGIDRLNGQGQGITADTLRTRTEIGGISTGKGPHTIAGTADDTFEMIVTVHTS